MAPLLLTFERVAPLFDHRGRVLTPDACWDDRVVYDKQGRTYVIREHPSTTRLLLDPWDKWRFEVSIARSKPTSDTSNMASASGGQPWGPLSDSSSGRRPPLRWPEPQSRPPSPVRRRFTAVEGGAAWGDVVDVYYPELRFSESVVLDDEQDDLQRQLVGVWVGQRTWVTNPHGERVVVTVSSVTRPDGTEAPVPEGALRERRPRPIRRTPGVPAHCPGSRDFGVFSRNTSVAYQARDVEYHSAQFRLWLSQMVEALSSARGTIVMVPELLADTFTTTEVIFNPDEVWLLVEVAKGPEDWVPDILYVALVSNNGDGEWHALSGYFLPFLREAGETAQSASDTVIDIVTELGGKGELLGALPKAISPQPGWFDDDRLQAVARLPKMGSGR